MADDLGYGDLGCYGSEIATPHLDNLAKNGVKFTQFYNAARCCPSRASLLTGVYPHEAGIGKMVVTNNIDRSKFSPTQGYLNHKTPTLAELLKKSGYQTFLAGKWHVGEEYPDWPLQRGFDKFYGLISGANSYYELLPDRILLENNEHIPYPDSTYFTHLITQKAKAFIDTGQSQSQPFFLYLAYTAPHWPLHAPKASIDAYLDTYKNGWDDVREKRFQKQQQLGLLPKNTRFSERPESISKWEETANQEQWIQKMATYAAMISEMDKGIGEIIEKLKEKKQLENTIIIFLSDNGGCAETIAQRAERDLGEIAYQRSLNTPIGAMGSYVSYDEEWANVSNVPFRWYKQYTHEGGIATPMIVHYPKMIPEGFQTNHVGHIMDIVPTLLEITETQHPAMQNEELVKLRGLSFASLLFKQKATQTHEFLAWEHFGSKAIRQGDWKLVMSRKTNEWELYNLKEDRSETLNLAQKFPLKVKNLVELYDNWATEVGAK